MQRLPVNSVAARSDACADEGLVCIGGWWHPDPHRSPDSLSKADVYWFSEPIRLEDLPFRHLFTPEALREPHRLISMLELLGILVLLLACSISGGGDKIDIFVF